MPAGRADDPPRVRSWITPKAVKGGASGIEGIGVHARDAIAGGEVVAVKGGGHIVEAGLGGNLLLVSTRDIAAGEELTLDCAMFLTDPGFAMERHCGAVACRGTVTGIDWMRADVQERYRGWFSWWLEQKITATRHDPAAGAGQGGRAGAMCSRDGRPESCR